MFPIADTAANVLPYSTFKSSLGLGIFIWTIVSRHIHAMTHVKNFTMEHAHEFIQNKQTQLIFRLGRKGADIYFGPDFMLAWAAWCGCIEFVEYFSDNGANIPLFGYYAIEAVLQEDGLYVYDRLQIVRRLLQHGARVSSTALQLARERNCDEINELLSLHYSIFADPEGRVSQFKRLKQEFCSVM